MIDAAARVAPVVVHARKLAAERNRLSKTKTGFPPPPAVLI
ncbi:hypothetical protein [Amycolatopsis nalaikhensis]|uniref:Transposase n=1 Tax=Amycolatopsis nalaikhensis TaxID=715472 RepID=A0ABY8Y054_9PSEU|nr:hypothetical protein [Amycolatopsis sp. 2-2]WIV60970.1 hypothetical protein QP939_21380 [Amycolatopsis sp. 2-2]